MIFNIPLNEIDETLLHGLVGTLEDGQIEFKEVLPSRNPNHIIEKFLKPISAMANTLGGDVLFGVREGQNSEGHTVASALVGVGGEDPDDVVQRLENLIRTSIDPRIVGHTIRPVRMNTGTFVYLVRVPKSWNSPHVVKHEGHWRFYYRNSAGSHPMDVTELRRAFTLADTVSQRLEGFRLERLSTIAGDETLATGGTIVLHLQPLDSLDPENVIDFLRARQDISRLFLINHCAPHLTAFSFINHYRLSVNFDGLLSVIERSPAVGYVQLYRSGVIESVDTGILDDRYQGVPSIPGTSFEQKIVDATLRYLVLLRDLEVRSPVLVNLSLLKVRGYIMQHEFERFGGTAAPRGSIDRDDLLLRSRLIQSIPPDLNEAFVSDVLREDFHAIWNATGFDGSPSYD